MWRKTETIDFVEGSGHREMAEVLASDFLLPIILAWRG